MRVAAVMYSMGSEEQKLLYEGPANTVERVRIVSDKEKSVAATLLAMTDKFKGPAITAK
jgi:hypothetical protein